MKPCKTCGAYGPGSQHTLACRKGKHIVRQVRDQQARQLDQEQARKAA